jgi:prepilin-type N-terminal cleavage/methylation domain-containing protein
MVKSKVNTDQQSTENQPKYKAANSRRLGFHAGFSLGEVLVAIIILSMLSVILVGVIPSAIFGLRESSQRSVAAQIAAAELEDARLQGLECKPHKIEKITRNGIEYWGELLISPSTATDGSAMDGKQTATFCAKVEWRTTGGVLKKYQSSCIVVKQL